MLESDEIDAVIIATPDHWHTLPAIHACQAGKDVYLEKPMTLTIREGRQLVAAVRKYQRVLQTGSQQRSIALNRLGCELVRNGAIGRVHTVIAANYESPWECALPAQEIPAGMDWDTWCGQTHVVPYHKDIQIPRANPGLDLVPTLVRRRDDRLGRSRIRPDPMGPGHESHRTGRDLDGRGTVPTADLHAAWPDRGWQQDRARVRWCVFATPTT